ncbi:MAG TPA: RND transporter, partial [Stellaceae bacterium]|nr:RND transporter [Stellaceae bacterium]
MSTAPRRFAVSLSVALALSGCAVGPDFLRPDPPAAERYTADPLPAQTASAAVVGGSPQHFVAGRDIPGDWWVL